MTNETNPLKVVLSVMAAIASVGAVSNLIAQFLRQDLFFVLAIVLLLGGFGLLLWKGLQSGWIVRQKLITLGLFLLVTMAAAVMSWVWLSNVKVRPVTIEIIEPVNAAQIEGNRYLVKGKVNDPDAKISVVVRPLEPLDYWVQETPTIDSGGNWQVNAHFSERNVGIGERYEVFALATRENFLVTWLTGNSLPVGKRQDLPSNTNRSNVITVTRVR
ncbi:MAG TPA: hypothetical protein VF658_12215 [Pyrinomonadaceae bacterium]|jgi:hypothetical protein